MAVAYVCDSCTRGILHANPPHCFGNSDRTLPDLLGGYVCSCACRFYKVEEPVLKNRPTENEIYLAGVINGLLHRAKSEGYLIEDFADGPDLNSFIVKASKRKFIISVKELDEENIRDH